MRKKKSQRTTTEIDRDLLDHIKSLGLATVDDYQEWCTNNDFSRKVNKNWKQRCRERYFHHHAYAQNQLRRKKREKRNHADVLHAICNGTLTEREVTQPHLKNLCEALRNKRGPCQTKQINREALNRLFGHLHKCRAKLFDGSPVVAAYGSQPGNTYIEAMAQIAKHADNWLRPVEKWKPRTHSASRQFASLLRHLLVRYNDVPLFFDKVWFAYHSWPTTEHRKWYLHVGRGQNIRNCQLPIPFTKRMAHHFMRAPIDVTLTQAIRWGQVLGLGGDDRLAQAILATRLGIEFTNDDFWSTVIRWFISHPMLDRVHVGPIVDYVLRQRFGADHLEGIPDHHEEVGPPQPNLTMKGRTPETMLRQVDEWHRTLANNSRIQIRQWKPTGIENFELIEGSQDTGSFKRWTIRELLTAKALFSEGRQMKHCVATYAPSCAKGQSSIWTMEVDSSESVRKAVTIEVQSKSNLICQVRGRANRFATEKERKVIERWAETNGLRVGNYVWSF